MGYLVQPLVLASDSHAPTVQTLRCSDDNSRFLSPLSERPPNCSRLLCLAVAIVDIWKLDLQMGALTLRQTLFLSLKKKKSDNEFFEFQ